MNIKNLKQIFAIALGSTGIFFSVSNAAMKESDNNTKITMVVVNGGIDSPNGGTSCIKVSETLSTSCAFGMIAIPKNNKELLSAALAAKATNSNIWLNYEDASASQHCPGHAFTSCTVSSIGIK